MAVYAALDENTFIQTGNIGIPESLIPGDAGETGKSYALARDAQGNLSSADVDAVSVISSTIVTAAPGDFVPDGNLYRCDISADDVLAETWVNVLPCDDNTAAFFKLHGKRDVGTYDGGFSIYTTAVPSGQLTIVYAAFKGTERGD